MGIHDVVQMACTKVLAHVLLTMCISFASCYYQVTNSYIQYLELNLNKNANFVQGMPDQLLPLEGNPFTV